MMQLSLKAIRFVIEALDHYQRYHDEQLREEGLSEEEVSDLINDQQYLAAIKQDFEKYRDDLLRQRQGVKAED
jgi:hypothetical protein